MTIIVIWILLGIIALIVIILHFSIIAEIKADKNGVDVKAKYMFFTVYPRPEKKVKPKKIKKRVSRKTKKVEKNDLFSDNLDDELSKLDEKIEDNSKELQDTYVDDSIKIIDHTTADFTPLKNKIVAEEVKTEKVTSQKSVSVSDEKKVKKKQKEKKVKAPKSEKKISKLEELKAQYKKYKPYFPAGWKCVKKLLKAIRFTNIDAEVTVGKEDAYEAAMAYGKLQAALFGAVGWLANIFTVKAKKIDVNCVFDKKMLDGEVFVKVKIRPSTIIAIAFCTLVKFLMVFFKQKKDVKRKSKR